MKHPVHLWTSPSERHAPFGPWGPPVGNAGALSTAGPHSRASRPQPAQDRQQLLFQEDKDWKVRQLLTGQSISGACAVGIHGCKSALIRPFDRSISSNMTRYSPQSIDRRDGDSEFSLSRIPTAQAPRTCRSGPARPRADRAAAPGSYWLPCRPGCSPYPPGRYAVYRRRSGYARRAGSPTVRCGS